jgi:hypothetical protein
VIGRGPKARRPQEMLTNLIKELNEIPEVIRALATERWELEKKLLSCKDDNEMVGIEESLYNTDQELEWLRNRHSAAATTVNLLAALTTAGRTEDVQSILAVLEKVKQPQEQDGNQAGNQKEEKGAEKDKEKEELKTCTFTIREAKPGKTADTVWAVAFAEDGAEFKICSKNGNGKTLLEAVGKRVKVRYRPMGEGKLFAGSVKIIQK